MNKLHAPFSISSRLAAALRIGEATISIDYGNCTSDGRMAWDIWIDLPSGEFHIDDMRSGVGRADLQDAFVNLLGFLTAAAESYDYRQRTGRTGENEDLFVPEIVEWASANANELSILACEIEEAETPLIEEAN